MLTQYYSVYGFICDEIQTMRSDFILYICTLYIELTLIYPILFLASYDYLTGLCIYTNYLKRYYILNLNKMSNFIEESCQLRIKCYIKNWC